MTEHKFHKHDQAYLIYLQKHPDGVRYRELQKFFHHDDSQVCGILNRLLRHGKVTKTVLPRVKHQPGNPPTVYRLGVV
jgi:hypothetical protein